jgi:hypothetical protein
MSAQMVVILRRFEKFVQAGQPHGAAPNQNHSHDKDTEADAHAHAKKMQQYMKFQRSTTRISIKIQLFTYLFGRLVDIYNLSHVRPVTCRFSHFIFDCVCSGRCLPH